MLVLITKASVFW